MSDIQVPSLQTVDLSAVEYAGFWRRFMASLLDGVFILMAAFLLVFLFILLGGGPGGFIGAIVLLYALPPVIIIALWTTRGGTPGKLLLDIEVVDATTGANLTVGRGVLRYIGYIVSAIPLYLGYLWMCWDERKQTWHDKFANSIVIHRRRLP